LTKPVGILGGTFDPVHNVHLAIARQALQALGARGIVFLPTGTPPYRPAPVAAGADRAAMLRLAVAGEAAFSIDERELAPGASGYTHDSIRALRAEDPGAELVLIMGGDQYQKRHSWHRWDELAKLCRIAVVARPGFDASGDGFIAVPLPPASVSSTDIRARLRRGDDVSALVPAGVLNYIRQKGLYR
jgi:nicotinate-nucleotide adenylyltransferase